MSESREPVLLLLPRSLRARLIREHLNIRRVYDYGTFSFARTFRGSNSLGYHRRQTEREEVYAIFQAGVLLFGGDLCFL